MIYFKIIPTLGQTNDNEFLIKKNASFLTIELKDIDYQEYLKKELKRIFGINFLISRTFLSLNKGEDLYLYIFVIPEKKEIYTDYNWMTKNELNPDNFGSYDSLAIHKILLEF